MLPMRHGIISNTVSFVHSLQYAISAIIAAASRRRSDLRTAPPP
jgi:hypothetical protein